RHRGGPAQQVDLGPEVAVADQQHGRSRTRRHRLRLAAGEAAQSVGEAGEHRRHRVDRRSCARRAVGGRRLGHQPAATRTTSSTSTGASSGNEATPTALRACCPASPNSSPIRLLAPLTTPGWPVNDGALATYPTTLTTAATWSRSPTTPFTAAKAFSAQIRAR